jgi:hypothetical protein
MDANKNAAIAEIRAILLADWFIVISLTDFTIPGLLPIQPQQPANNSLRWLV